jgi:hypothetical protein
VIASAIVFLALLTLAMAQSAAPRVQLRGTVVDPQGMPVPNAEVVARNADFGERKTTTDDAGNFIFPFLSAGTYTVSASAPGMVLKKPARVVLAVGSAAQLTLQLGLKAGTQSTTVTAAGGTQEGQTLPPAMNKQSAVTSNTIAGLTVTYLPNRNRDFAQFQQLASGAVEDPQGGTAILGQRSMYSAASVDGAELTDVLTGGQRSSGDGELFFPQTAVREFQVMKTGAPAEVGGTNAGFVNIATKEGANKPRFEAFYIGRPAAFTSHDAFGRELDNVQNEFGGSVGGPIRKNQAFFFVGFEQDFLRIPAWTQFAAQAPGTAVPAALTALEHENVEHSSPTALFLRGDWLLPKQNTLTLQGNFNRIHADTLMDPSTRTLSAPEQPRDESGHSTWLRANLTSVISPQLVNQLLVQWARDTRRWDPVSTAPEQEILGFGTLGGDARGLERYGLKRGQVSEDVSLTRGSSTLTFGANYFDAPIDYFGVENVNGRQDFNSLAAFLANTPRRTQQTFILGDPRMRGSVGHFGTHMSGRFDVLPTLTITAGVRFDAQWNPQPPATHVPDDLTQWQPRLGVAWNPRPRTVVRLSSGLYDAPTPALLFSRLFSENRQDAVLADLIPTLSPSRVFTIDRDFRNPRSFQAAATVEQEINAKLTASLGYARNSTWNLPRLADRNLNVPTIDATGMPIFPVTLLDTSIGQLLTYESRAHASFDGLLATANLQLPKRSSLAFNYTLSRTRDDHPLDAARDVTALLNPFVPSLDAGYSSLDARHSFNVSGVVNLPAGFKVNPIIIARSGLPYTPVIGFDTQNDLDDRNDRAIINGHIAERNSLRQPAFFNLDLRFVKDFTLKGEGRHLDLFLDVLNVTGATNRNFGPDAVGAFGNSAFPVFTAGQPLFAPRTSSLGGARQVQFTARLVAF